MITDGIAGGRTFEADDDSNVASTNLCDVFALIGLHADDTADAFFLAGRAVQDIAAGLQFTGINAEVGQLADERVGGDLEGQAGEWLGFARLTLDLVAGLGVCAP